MPQKNICGLVMKSNTYAADN